MDYVILSRLNERFLIVFSFTFTPNQGSMSINDVNPGKSTNEVSLFVLGAPLDKLRGIAELCDSHIGIHEPKERDNHHKDKPGWGTNRFL